METNSGTQSVTKKCGCSFKIRSTQSKDGYGWMIDVKCGLYYYSLPDRFKGHLFLGRLIADEKQMLFI